MAIPHNLSGGCHCGALAVAFETDREPSEFVPRRCQCSFCTKHGAAYISDPAGTLTLTYEDPDLVQRYRFGHGTLDMVFCKRCGVVVGALSEHDGALHAVVNVRALNGVELTAVAQPMDVEGENPDERLKRRAKNWIGQVVLRSAGS